MRTSKVRLPKERREKIKISLSPMERFLVEEKMRQYGYSTIAGYVRDACIYENLIVETIEEKKEILREASCCIELLREILKQQSIIFLRTDISKEDMHMVKQQNEEILNAITNFKDEIEVHMKVTYRKDSTRKKISQASFFESEDK